ncbi:putative multidrug resistance protein fnx1 [Xylariaceae sp. FL0594]|nr:putative multidrug resistance protein fnx1 [Xylariaceae sp. FL0594]
MGVEETKDTNDGVATQRSGENEIPMTMHYLDGWRVHAVFASLAAMMFMVTFEIPVVATSIVAITTDLGGANESSWLLTSYLLGYVSIIVISAKLSNMYGRRLLYASCVVIFLVASAACSAAQTINQLIVFRAFQGAGGGGAYSLGTVISAELYPVPKFPVAAAQLSIAVSCGLLLGPIIGGVISSNTTWRWIFIIIVPVAAICLTSVLAGMPKDFPLQGQVTHLGANHHPSEARSTLRRLDVLGAVLLLFSTVALTAGFEEAGSLFPWKSAYVITLLVTAGVLNISLLAWEHHLTNVDGVMEPILPSRFFSNRFVSAILFTFFFLGGPFVIAVYQLPQKFQLVNGLSGLDAGIRLIPFTLASPLGTGFAARVSGQFKIPPIWIILTGAILQVIGFALLGTLPKATELLPRTYGFEIISGFGCGMNLALLFVIVPQVAEKRDRAVVMASASQFRMVGSAVAAAIVNSVFNGYTKPRIASLGLSTVDPAPSSTGAEGDAVRLVYAGGYNLQFIVLAAFAAAQIPAALLFWRRPQITV